MRRPRDGVIDTFFFFCCRRRRRSFSPYGADRFDWPRGQRRRGLHFVRGVSSRRWVDSNRNRLGSSSSRLSISFFYWLDLFFLWIEFDPTFDLAKHLRASPFVCFRRFFLFPMTSILRKCFVFSEFFTFFCHFMRLVSDRPSLRVNSHPYDCNR